MTPQFQDTDKSKRTTPMVSVAMITYNHEPYVRMAIECILQQKRDFPIELVIGEDLSTDGTRQIVLEYARQFPETIRLILSDKNVGARTNTLRVLNACKGKYIAFCEGDDYWHRDDKLRVQVDFLESHEDYGLVATDFDHVQIEGGHRIERYRSSIGKPVKSNPTVEDILTGKSGIQTLTVLARRELIMEIRSSDPILYDGDQFLMGDTQTWAEISLRSKIHCIDESFATHLVLQESATQSKDKSKVMRFRMNGAELCLYLCAKHKLPDYLRELHERTWTRIAIRLAFAEADPVFAEIVRKRFSNLSIKDRLWYWGTKYSAMRCIVMVLLKVLRRNNQAKRTLSR